MCQNYTQMFMDITGIALFEQTLCILTLYKTFYHLNPEIVVYNSTIYE